MCFEDVYSAVSEGLEIKPELLVVGGRCGEEHRPDGHAKDYSGPLEVEVEQLKCLIPCVCDAPRLVQHRPSGNHGETEKTVCPFEF